MDRIAAVSLAEELMSLHGLEGWEMGFNRRRRALGLCRYDRRRIELSIPFVIHNTEEAVRDTLLHEIAHALAGREAHHGPAWKAVCVRLGCRPERCDNSATMPPGRWQGFCPTCNKRYSRHRRPIRNRLYCCRICGPDLGPIKFAKGMAMVREVAGGR